jgi:cell division protein FtsI (penicillin-binding protein 3)
MPPKSPSPAEKKAPMAVDPIKIRVTALMLFCIVFAAAVLIRAAMVQVANNPRLEQMARRQFQSKVLIRPRRGAILDRNGEPLAINVETSSLAANPSKIENPRSLAKLLSRATDVPYRKILQRLSGEKEFVWIKRHLSEQELRRLKKFHLIDADGDLIGGMLMVKESKRVYPHNELAAHLLGDVNVDSDGVEGVELWQNERMRGKILSVNAIKDAMGRPTFIDAVTAKSVQDHRDGEPVSLTIDSSLQFAVEQELKNTVAKSNAKGGTVIVMNAVNGEILAMANQPAYNPNDKSVPADRRRNRALTDGYEPGSTMKAVLMSSALSNGWKLSDQVWGEQGQGFKVQGKKISEAEAHEKYGWLNLNQIMQFSSNVGAAKVALKLGADKYFASLKAMGFGTKTGTGFPGEISGLVPPRKSWQPLTLANVGFGQGILVTPIQMTRAYAAFLNGGWLVQPKLIKDVGNEAPRRVLSPKVAGEMLDNLRSPTSEGGTGIKANLSGYVVAGKTGTAQKVDPNTHGYSRSHYVASFIGMPLAVEPKIVIFTAVDEPRGVIYASETAAPLFREVLNAVANRFSLPVMPETPNRVLADAAKTAAKLAAAPRRAGAGKFVTKPIVESDAIKLSLAHPATSGPATEAAAAGSDPDSALHWQGATEAGHTIWTMPSLKGLTPREALRALQGHQFQLEMRGAGVIRSQFPGEGGPLIEGGIIKLSLSEI